jgi:hypothetical protein
MENNRLASVYRFEVFPVGMAELLQQIVLYQSNSLTQAFCDIEIFGGEHSALMFQRLLLDEDLKADLRSKQENYLKHLARLPRAAEVISSCVAAARSVA